MTRKSLSALIVAHNEEDQLEECLQSVSFADQVVVVLDRCTDRSRDIAHACGATVVEGAWPIEGDRRNTGIDRCAGDWILEVDADERVPAAMAQEIRQKIETVDEGYFLVPFDNYIGNRLVRYGWGASWGVSSAPRLFRKGAKRWGAQRIHPSLELNGPRHQLENRMIHLVDRNISDMIQRLDRYTTAKARDLRANPDGVGFARNIRRIFSRFYKCYVSRKGYREGKYGFLIALMAAIYPVLSYLKAVLEEE